jgi:hypothetical protein
VTVHTRDVPWDRLGKHTAALVNGWEGLTSAQKAEMIQVAPEVYFAAARIVRCMQIAEGER